MNLTYKLGKNTLAVNYWISWEKVL